MPDDSRVKRLEESIDRVALRLKEAVKRQAQLYPRPLGARRVKTDELRLEYQAMKDSPELLAQFLEQEGASITSALDWAERMEKEME